uniref:G patch domain-containing protein 4 n=2 Tax=Monopterus albus TaxID=43700 RepID=A0A3Q3IKL3_MONAL|nr:G patch domain-containing protein 4 isoform X2 [Monopterus albus]XP_020480691.1 G patch domain-containing protein 4 isoform X2 [Monopterus albus]
MAEIVQEKSRGLKFAEQQLLRHGWEHGKGLGRAENGISEAIKVKVKCDKGGVGHKEGEQFTFHWWDHVFNKASSSLQVAPDDEGVRLKKTVQENEEDGMVSNKKPRKASLAKAKLYGCFVKSATLLSGQEQPEPKSSSSDEEEEEDQNLDLSSTTKLSDADLMKACGGRTAHKGARHGLTMSAKLARLEQQEAEFMAKYGKKSQPAGASPVCAPPASPTSQSAQRAKKQEEKDPLRKTKKKKRSTGSINELNGEVSESPMTDVKLKKKKKAEEMADVVSTEEHVLCIENNEVDYFHKTKRKHKQKKANVEQNGEERVASPAVDSKSPEATDLNTNYKGRKKLSKHHSEDKESIYTASVHNSTSLAKSKKAAVLLEEAEVREESTVKQRRKKCARAKPTTDFDVNEEVLPPPKKKFRE